MNSTLLIPRDVRVFVAGHRGLVGSAILRLLEREGFTNVIVADRTSLDLRNPTAVEQWSATNSPQCVFLVAGTVGGILANSTRPAEFLYDNLMIHASVVHAADLHGVERLLYLGSSCIYPRLAPQPMKQNQLLAGPLEPTNEPYAVAKIAASSCAKPMATIRLSVHFGHAKQPVRAARQLQLAFGTGDSSAHS